MKLIIGNRNYSSWSLRPYVAMKAAGIPFDVERISFNDPTWKSRVGTRLVPAKVPVLVDGDETIWDSLAILEYLAERFPERGLWPSDASARAIARSVCAEMHSSFSALRQNMPMNVTASLPGFGWNLAVQADIERLCALWAECRARFGSNGPFLFGQFSNADAMFAPVVLRFISYEVRISEDAATYCKTIREMDAVKTWVLEARSENEFVVAGEPYRRAPTAT
jgi:glutathione S-transferase